MCRVSRPIKLKASLCITFYLFFFFGSIQSKNHYVAPRAHPQLALCNPQYEKATRNICVQLHLKKVFPGIPLAECAHTHSRARRQRRRSNEISHSPSCQATLACTLNNWNAEWNIKSHSCKQMGEGKKKIPFQCVLIKICFASFWASSHFGVVIQWNCCSLPAFCLLAFLLMAGIHCRRARQILRRASSCRIRAECRNLKSGYIGGIQKGFRLGGNGVVEERGGRRRRPLSSDA